MTKQKFTMEESELIRKETQEDPLDGTKAAGCLFIGIILIIAFIALFKWIIHLLR